MKKKSLFLLGFSLLMSSQLSYAGIVIEGGISGNSGTSGYNGTYVGIGGSATNGGKAGDGVGIVINGNSSSQQKNGSASQSQNDIYASICASPFMKKFVPACQ
ncbi:hypothetical protein [Serratia ureilytica]|uniref:hypothetical protein n=1 Tax=Serratia ureilytica TaxID=300181 RepID=UPI0018E7B41F|nr:hypothetical protein [Serratia ureilytica]MBJ2099148.1 hypothetical protein [Serratia ureilytica]